MDEALFILELIGVRVFKKESAKIYGRTRNSSGPTNVAKSDDIVAKSTQSKPELPDYSLGPCVFAKTALMALLASGYQFTDDQILQFGSVDGSKLYTTRNLPMFWILKDGESRQTCEKNIRSRYWKDEFVSGGYRFLMYSQWYENSQKGATKDHFISWYNTL